MSYETDDRMVSHPNHYKSGKYEVIDIIDEFTKDLKGTEAVCTANAIKYILRWKKKNGIQDVKKAIWYLTHLVEHLEDVDLAKATEKEWGIQPDDDKKELNHTCNNCAYAYRHDGVLHCGNNSGLPCWEEFLNGNATCSAWESIGEPIDKEESDLSVKTHTNAAGVTVPDSEPWSSSKCPICKFELRKPNLEPCKSCKMYSNWKPKEAETNEQSSET